MAAPPFLQPYNSVLADKAHHYLSGEPYLLLFLRLLDFTNATLRVFVEILQTILAAKLWFPGLCYL